MTISGRLCDTLIDQQMWCWGCDVRAESNLLLTYGACRRPSPNPRFHSAYSFALTEARWLTIWGWGMWIADVALGSVFISRTRFRLSFSPDAVLMPEAWCAADLPPIPMVSASALPSAGRALVGACCLWIADYETWLTGYTPDGYRDRAISAYPGRRQHGGGIPSAEMPGMWRLLAGSFAV